MSEGYLMVDHRASPGIPADLALKMGRDPKLCGEGKLFEAATLTCSHCTNVVVKNPLRVRERGFCAKCNGFVCDGCHAAMHLPEYTHKGFKALVDTALNAAVNSNSTIILP